MQCLFLFDFNYLGWRNETLIYITIL